MGFEYGKPNLEFGLKLAQSGLWFAARKSYQEADDLAQSLNNNGTKISWNEFKKRAAPIVGKYNQQWLQTEYNTAVRSARIASVWKDIERTADLYPNIEYIRTRSAEPRETHLRYVGIIRPINDPFWRTHTPPLAWLCKCSIRPSKDKVTPIPDGLPEPDPGLANNPGLSETLFSEDHPYAKNAKAVEEALRKEFSQLRAQMGLHFKIKTPGKNLVLVHPGHTVSDIPFNLPTAVQLTDAGYKVELPAHSEQDGLSRPDFKINGNYADLKEPASDPKNLPSEPYKSFKKLIDSADNQKVRTVVFRFNRSQIQFTINDIERGINRSFSNNQKPINTNIENIIIIDKNDKIIALKRKDIINKKVKWKELDVSL